MTLPNVVYRCADGCDAIVGGPDQVCLSCAARYMCCVCDKPKPIAITDETFRGFTDEPIVVQHYYDCERCGKPIPQATA